ncbi:DUF2975 domain-containing protein [Clostridium perfringens]|nr:DUF2975 domain-containing protein [Clostridium perfringens]
MKSNITSKILDYVVAIGIILTILLLIGTPLLLAALFKSHFSMIDSRLIWTVTICIYICAIPYVLALFKVKTICHLIKKENPFSFKIVKSLQVICICSFTEIITFSLTSIYLKYSIDFFEKTIIVLPILIISFICVTIGLLCMVLAKLFERFIEIKEENDKTI